MQTNQGNTSILLGLKDEKVYPPSKQKLIPSINVLAKILEHKAQPEKSNSKKNFLYVNKFTTIIFPVFKIINSLV